MSSTHDVTFHKVPPEVFAQIQEKVLGNHGGTAMDDNTVEISGVRCAYLYDAGEQNLHVSIHMTPRIVTQGYAIGWIHDAIRRYAVKP